MKIIDNVENGCCECCNTDDQNNASYFVPAEGRNVWLCENCAKLYADEIED